MLTKHQKSKLLLLTQFLPGARGTRRRYHRIPPDLRRCLSQELLISVPFTAVTRQKETPLPALFSRASRSQMKTWLSDSEGTSPQKAQESSPGRRVILQESSPGRRQHSHPAAVSIHPAVPDALGAPRDAGGGSHAMPAAPGPLRSPTACHTFKGRRRQAAAVCICRRNCSGGISSPLGWNSSARQKAANDRAAPGWGRR